jgi:Xaa-Pro dipeptidase
MDKWISKKIGCVLRESGADKILLFNTGTRDPNFLYVTGFNSGLFEGTFTLVDEYKITVFASPLEYEDAKRMSKGQIEVIKVGGSSELSSALEKEVKGSILGVDGDFLPYKRYISMKNRLKPKKMVDASAAFLNARIIKSEPEVRSIGKAASITKEAMRMIEGILKAGITEREIASSFDSISCSIGSEEPSFKTIVCFGKNAAMPHHSPDSTRLKKGDLVLIDAGAKVGNYCSDITRTILFGIQKKSKKSEMHEIVEEAQSLAIKAIKPGATGKDIHAISANHINTSAKGAYNGTFIHSLGHQIGIEVHDGGLGLSPTSDLKLKEGMVVSVEPGIYLPGSGGVRIEDDILVTRKGARIL